MKLRITILGKGSPNVTEDGRKTMCAAGLSDSFGLVRVYPFNVETQARIWDVIEVDVEKNDKDTRLESWKIIGSKDNFREQQDGVFVVGRVSNKNERREILESCVLRSGETDPIDYLNERKMSLAVVVPEDGATPSHTLL